MNMLRNMLAAASVTVTPFVAISATGRPVAFDGNGWKFKMVNGQIELKDGKPIVVKPDGTEISYDIEQTSGTISRLTNELTTAKNDLATAKNAAKAFEGMNADEVKAALETVGKIKDKKLFESGEVDTLKQQIAGGYEAKLKESGDKYSALLARTNALVLGNAFASSKFVKDKVGIPVEMLQSFFGNNFIVDENGKISAKGKDGNPLLSPARIGEPADFEEAIESMVNAYPNKAHVLKGTSHSGTGGGSPGTPDASGRKQYIRSALEKMTPAEQSSAMKEVREGKATLTEGAAA